MIAGRIIMSWGSTYISIAATVRSPDIAALARARGWNGTGPIFCTINPGVDVAGLVISNVPDDCVTLINLGRIGGVINGGTAIYTRKRIRIDNAGGIIFGGGGRGGRGGSLRIQNPNSPSYFASGSGGDGGAGAGFTDSGAVSMVSAVSGDYGRTETLGGASTGGIGSSTGGRGGSGGAIGMPGASGASGTASGNYTLIQIYQPGEGQAAGYYVDGASLTTWISPGTRMGNAAN